MMKWIEHLAGRKYLQRILFTFNVSMAGLLFFIAISFYVYAQQIMLQTQQEANRKVLSQIKHNIHYIHDIVQNISVMASLEQSVIYLMNAQEPDPVMKFQTLRKLDTLADSTTFVDSILVFNGELQQFYSGGSGQWSRQNGSELQQRLLQLLDPLDADTLGQLVPLQLYGGDVNVDVFSYIVVEKRPIDGALPNAVIVNIRPQWIFDNVMNLDNMSDGASGMLLVNKHGDILRFDSATYEPSLAIGEYVRQSATVNHSPAGDLSVQTIEGQKYVIAEMNVGVSQWKVMNVLPYKAVMGKAEALRNVLLLLVFTFLTASFVLSLVVSSRLYRPVGKLFELFKRYDAKGDTPESGGDEMRFITDVYRHTLEQLRRVHDEGSRRKQIVGDYYLRSWLGGSHTLSEEEWMLGMTASPQLVPQRETLGWRLVVMALDQPTATASEQYGNEEKLHRFAMCNIVEETLAQCFANRVVDMNNEYMVVIMPETEMADETETLIRLLQQAQNTFQRYYRQRTFCAAISERVADNKQMTAMYEWTAQHVMYRLAFGPGAIITQDRVAGNMERGDFTLPVEWEKRLVESIRAKDTDEIKKQLARIFELIASVHYDYMTYAVLQVLLLIKQVLREPIFSGGIRTVELQTLNQKVIKAESLPEMERMIGDVLSTLCEEDQTQAAKEDRSRMIVDTIKELIENNYADVNLGLPSIAEHLKLSAAYAGRIFKQYEQQSIGDYLTAYRLEKARELLQTSHFNVKEIADYLGFSNASYFITLFKKKYGTTPKEYRMKLALGQ